MKLINVLLEYDSDGGDSKFIEIPINERIRRVINNTTEEKIKQKKAIKK